MLASRSVQELACLETWIVRQADQFPFALHLPQAAEQELPEALPVLDLAERRFDDRFAYRVFLAAFRSVGQAFVPNEAVTWCKGGSL